MSQASVLSDSEVKRVFRIIETTRHSDRSRLAFILLIYAGMRVGEIAALKTKDVANQFGEARREIKLAADQTKGSYSRTVILPTRAQKEIESYLNQHRFSRPEGPLIRSQRCRAFSGLTLSMLFKEIYGLAGIQTSSHSGRRTFATRLNAKGVGMRTIQKLMGHRHIGTTALYCDVAENVMRNAVELV
jgi:integrase/recombinase XerD